MLLRNCGIVHETISFPVTVMVVTYPTQKNFHRNLNLAISLRTNSLYLTSAYYYIFKNFSMIAYLIEIQKSKFANILFNEFDHFESRR